MNQNDAGPYWGASGGADYARAFSGDILCKVCGGPVDPQEVRRGFPKEHCSPACRAQASRDRHQGELFPAVSNPDKQTRAEKVLERLRQGPATSLDLLKAGGGMRGTARVHELRRAGKRILGPLPWTRPDGTVETETIPRTADGHEVYGLRGE